MKDLDLERLAREQLNFRESDILFINSLGYNKLHYAIQKGEFERALVLIEKGIDVNQYPHDGFTALHCLARNYHEKIALSILERVADINVTNKYLNTPLMSAIAHCQYNYANILIKHGANLDIENHTGLTPHKLIFLHIERFPDNEELKKLIKNT